MSEPGGESPIVHQEAGDLVMVRAGLVPYEVAWAEQRRLHAARLAGEVPDTVLLLEHPSVYTAGRRTEAWEQPVDVVAYVRRLEAALIAACAGLGVATTRVSGRSGVWLPADDRGPERKVAAIGIRVSRGVTMHGFALNCDPDLTAFDRIVACGIADAGVTSLTAELGWGVSVADAIDVVEAELWRAGLTGQLTVAAAPALLAAR